MSDGVRLGESIILPHGLKKCTVLSPSYLETGATGRAQLCPPPLQPPWAAESPLRSLAGPGKIKGTDDSAWRPFVTPVEGTSCSVNSQAWSRVS